MDFSTQFQFEFAFAMYIIVFSSCYSITFSLKLSNKVFQVTDTVWRATQEVDDEMLYGTLLIDCYLGHRHSSLGNSLFHSVVHQSMACTDHTMLSAQHMSPHKLLANHILRLESGTGYLSNPNCETRHKNVSLELLNPNLWNLSQKCITGAPPTTTPSRTTKKFE